MHPDHRSSDRPAVSVPARCPKCGAEYDRVQATRSLIGETPEVVAYRFLHASGDHPAPDTVCVVSAGEVERS